MARYQATVRLIPALHPWGGQVGQASRSLAGLYTCLDLLAATFATVRGIGRRINQPSPWTPPAAA